MFLLSLSNARTSTVRPFKFAFYLLSEWKSSNSSSKKNTTNNNTRHTQHIVCGFFLRLLSFMLLFSPLLAFVSYTVEFLWIFTQNVSMSSKPDCMYVLKRKTKTNSLLVQHLVPVIVCVAVFSTLSVLDSCVLLLFAFAVSVASIFDSILSDFFSVRVQDTIVFIFSYFFPFGFWMCFIFI